MREKAIALYHEMLASDDGLDADFLNGLREKMRARGLMYGARPIGVSLRPHMLARSQYDALVHASEVLAGAFEKIGRALVADESLLERVGLTDSERRLALVSPGFASPAINTRLDAFVHGDQIKFVEYNAENPSSLPDQSGLNEVLFETRAMQAMCERYRLRQFDPVESLLQAVLATYEEWLGRAATPQVAIVDWANLPTAGEFALLRNYFAGRGVPTIICSPDELEYDGECLRRGEFRIDLVLKRIIIHEFLSRYDETHPLARAYTQGRVCLLNPFRCKILHKKAGFELLTGEDEQRWFDAREQEVIHACVPWTRRVAHRSTLYHGQRIDLPEFIRKHRADFILKPNDDYGGHGIFFGNQSSESEWDAHISEALAADYVVQEIVALHMEEFPVFDERRWSVQPMYVDTNPFIFRGRVEGALVRLSDSPLVNVTSGGGETGFFVIEDELGV